MEDQADRTVAVTCCYLPLSTTGHPCSFFATPLCTMSTPSAVKQRPSSTRHSRITVEYHRPSRESIQEYGALLDQANLHATSNNSSTFIPSRLAPPPPPSGPSSFKPKDPLSPTTTSPTSPPPKVRNSLKKPQQQRNRKPSIQTDTIRANHNTDPPTPNNTDLSPAKSSFLHSNGSSPNVVSPSRPSRTNTTNLNDIFPTQSAISQRRISSPAIGSTHDYLASYITGDPAPPVEEEEEESPPPHPILSPIMNTPSTPLLPSSFTTNGTGTTRARSATVNKGNKGMLGFVSGLLGSNKRVEISTPYDPVHLTHVGFNTSTGEFTGLPKEWQQLLQESGISRTEQEKNPEAVMEIVKFYQEGGGGGDVWDKMGGALKAGPPILPAPPPSKPLMDESFYTPVCFSLLVFLPILTPNSGQHRAHQSGNSNRRRFHNQTRQPLRPLHPRLPALPLRRTDRVSTVLYPLGRNLRLTALPCLGQTLRRTAEPRLTAIPPRTNNLSNHNYRHCRHRRNPRSTPVPNPLPTILPRTSKHTTNPSNPVNLEQV